MSLTTSVLILLCLDTGWKCYFLSLFCIKKQTVSILLCLDTGWKQTIKADKDGNFVVSILLCLDTGWKGLLKNTRELSHGFNPLMSGYGLEGMRPSMKVLSTERVSILLCLDTGWKTLSKVVLTQLHSFQSSYVWIRAGRNYPSLKKKGYDSFQSSYVWIRAGRPRKAR